MEKIWTGSDMTRWYYTKDETRELVASTQARGVKIVPWLDLLGHAIAITAVIRSWPAFRAYPLRRQ